jgi:hypothetical protein
MVLTMAALHRTSKDDQENHGPGKKQGQGFTGQFCGGLPEMQSDVLEYRDGLKYAAVCAPVHRRDPGPGIGYRGATTLATSYTGACSIEHYRAKAGAERCTCTCNFKNGRSADFVRVLVQTSPLYYVLRFTLIPTPLSNTTPRQQKKNPQRSGKILFREQQNKT